MNMYRFLQVFTSSVYFLDIFVVRESGGKVWMSGEECWKGIQAATSFR